MQDMGELISLGLTVPTVIMAAAVVYIWGPVAWASLRRNGMDARAWFIVGVAFGFAGETMDNLYWSAPWTAAFLDHPSFPALTEAGVFPNIIFRQGLGCFAAYCHLRAASQSELPSHYPGLGRRYMFANWILAVTFVAGAAWASLLMLLKTM